ncbi:class I SAM-dependent methyltransferase [Nocardia aurantiaca]|uniref:S-adenosyl-L-methionine-dependent methyltransferase n=1 Tax=Nocardia aurantiaca TaxID=2675850 RepID=A0A6I3L654_9NOCA|nr:class I SAM-dependent methyltransferase [Nocardia aurantiaca]MTE16005.1 SAM-dependent methyltransferase [Nocardia aurantiaca]
METGRASKTALATAYARAYHQLSGEPRVFTDPLAARILGLTADRIADVDAAVLDRPGGNDPRRRLRRYFLGARARFAEEVVARAVAEGTEQVVILGAGLDTFGYRNPHPGLRVFEVDHPDTQGWKREMLAQAAIEIPESLTFVPVDFETDTLAESLAAAGVDREKSAVFVWLGVVMYLTRPAIEETLRFIVDQGRPVHLVLDYLSAGTTDEERAYVRARSERIAAMNEPWLSFFEAEEIDSLLRSFGFDTVEARSLPDLFAEYLGEPLADLSAGNGRAPLLHASRSAD